MSLRPVAFVFFECISRINFRVFYHHPVSCNLGYNRCGCNGQHLGIPFYDGLLRQIQFLDLDCVKQQIIQRIFTGISKLLFQIADRPAHGQFGRLQNIDLIDHLMVCHTDAPGDRVFFDFDEKLLPSLFRKFLGIVYSQYTKFLRKHHSRRNHRTGQRSSAHLVDPGDAPVALLMQFFLRHFHFNEPLLLFFKPFFLGHSCASFVGISAGL